MRAGRPATEGMRQTTLHVNQQTLSLSRGAVEAFRNSGLSGDTASTEPGSATPSAQGGSSNGASSILSSADAYARRSLDYKLSKGASEVRVFVRLRCVGGSTTLVSELVLKRVAVTLPMLTCKRRKIDNAKKLEIIDLAAEKGVSHAINVARNTVGYERLTRSQLQRWRRNILKPKRKGGRPTCSDDFSRAVLNNLMYGSIDKAEGEDRLRLEANVAYGYDIVKHAAREAQKLPAFAQDKRVQKYKFSSSWVRTWVKNMKLRRRRVTTTTKILPSPEKVQEQMLLIQEHVIDFELDEIISADETGFNYGALPLNQFVPHDAERATAPDSDEKARFTAMLWGVAAGYMGSIFAIIKCSAKGANLTNTRVLKTLHADAGFTAQDGWTLLTWTKDLTLTEKKKEVTRTYQVPYLWHTNGNIITIQHKAWMDTVRVCMWIDLQLGPYYETKRGFAGLVWDNCGPHGVTAVKNLAKDWGISLLPLPPNMTDVLQVECQG